MEKDEKTLNEFINAQIRHYALNDDDKTKKKIRTKLIRTITHPKPNSYFKGKNIWKDAETITQNGAKTKILTTESLNHLAQETQNYFENLSIKTGGLTAEEFKKLKEEHNQNYNLALTNQQNYDYAKGDEQNIQDMYDKYTQKIMLQAIFEHFYKLDKDKIKRDLSTLYYANEPIEFSIDPAILSADNRLNHPKENYYKPRGK